MNFKQPKVYLAIIIAFCFLSNQVNAQLSEGEAVPPIKEISYSKISIGFEIGYNNNYLLTNVTDLNSTEYSSKSGGSIGMPIIYKVNDWFSMEANPTFIEKNYSMKRTGYYTGVYRDTKNTYFQVPLMGQFSFGGEKLKGYLDLGVYAAYWSSSQITGAMPNILNQPQYGTYINNSNTFSSTIFQDYNAYNFDEPYQFNSNVDNRLELGVIIGVGLSYQLKENGKLFIETKYIDATTDQQKKYQQGLVPKYNETYSFSVGYLFQLKKKVHTKIKKRIQLDSSSIN